MIIDGLTGPTLISNVQQTIHLAFNFGRSGISSLQELNTNSGLVQAMPLVSSYHLDLTLDGGGVNCSILMIAQHLLFRSRLP